jgi:hypothetical protein
MAINIFQGLRVHSNWSLQRIKNVYNNAWVSPDNINEEDPLNELIKFQSSGFIPSFDGTFYLENSSPSGLPSGNAARGMFGWVRAYAANISNEEGLFGYGPPNSSSGYDHNNLFYGTDNGVTFRGGDAFDPDDPNNTISTNFLTFVGMTWDGTTLTLYVNDNSWTTTPGDFNTALGYIRIALGDYWANTLSGVFTGNIVDVGMWGRCPTSDEIAALYNAGPQEYDSLPNADFGLETSGGDEILCSNGDILDAFASVGNGLVSFWNLSESSGTRYDSINYPSGNNLTPVSI